jgi:hypothetical protein
VPRGYRKDGSKLTPDPVQTKYSESYVARVFELCLLGLKDKQIGELLGVSGPTILRWKSWRREHPKLASCSRLLRNLLTRAAPIRPSCVALSGDR